MLNGKKAIFFDADGTLIDHKACEKQALVYVFDKLSLQYDDVYQGMFRKIEGELWANAEIGLISHEGIFEERFESLFKAINVGYDDYFNANELFKTGLAGSIALLNGAHEIISYLYDKGFMLCVITNGLIELQKPRVMNSLVGTYISHIIVSEEVGAHKPIPLIFNTLLKRIGLNVNDVIMIGDSLQNDIQGAINAGIQCVWFNPNGAINTTNIQPDYEIQDLSELIGKNAV
jgi:YjjG family noncanonical pyrimidine nucleotidase